MRVRKIRCVCACWASDKVLDFLEYVKFHEKSEIDLVPDVLHPFPQAPPTKDIWLSPHEAGKALHCGCQGDPLHRQLLWRQCCMDVASDRHLDITFGLQVFESSSLVSLLFREVFRHT